MVVRPFNRNTNLLEVILESERESSDDEVLYSVEPRATDTLLNMPKHESDEETSGNRKTPEPIAAVVAIIFWVLFLVVVGAVVFACTINQTVLARGFGIAILIFVAICGIISVYHLCIACAAARKASTHRMSSLFDVPSCVNSCTFQLMTVTCGNPEEEQHQDDVEESYCEFDDDDIPY